MNQQPPPPAGKPPGFIAADAASSTVATANPAPQMQYRPSNQLQMWEDSEASEGSYFQHNTGAVLPQPQQTLKQGTFDYIQPHQGPKPIVKSPWQPVKQLDPTAATHFQNQAKRVAGSYALNDTSDVRTNLGNTAIVMGLLSEMWIINLFFILGGTWIKAFYLGSLQEYDDYQLWNNSCYWKVGLLLPLPYTLVCFFGLTLPFRTPKFLTYEGVKKRRVDNLYILTVTKGDNRDVSF
ncbi:hypothetical protein BC830DRAFT_1122463 [Chytriomyces sp. MP71]|nr:hypothetical protein BC830DRAFT_1122463 [Chytriomyces sp. MP71]